MKSRRRLDAALVGAQQRKHRRMTLAQQAASSGWPSVAARRARRQARHVRALLSAGKPTSSDHSPIAVLHSPATRSQRIRTPLTPTR